jgi:hypothetical protein
MGRLSFSAFILGLFHELKVASADNTPLNYGVNNHPESSEAGRPLLDDGVITQSIQATPGLPEADRPLLDDGVISQTEGAPGLGEAGRPLFDDGAINQSQSTPGLGGLDGPLLDDGVVNNNDLKAPPGVWRNSFTFYFSDTPDLAT